MSATPLAWIPDHQRERESVNAEDCRPVSAEAGGRPVSATRVEVRGGRVVFAPDVPLWVYRSYPLAITPRPGPASEPRVPAWHIRGIFVEPQDLIQSDEFRDCSVVYAMWPNAAAWWEAAPFTKRHSDNVLSYDRLFTSLLPFPEGCDVSLQGEVRPVPIRGHLKDGLTGDRHKTSVDGKKVDVRSALMLDPVRVAPEWTTGRRARGHASESGSPGSQATEEMAGAEHWHWAVVNDLDGCLEALLQDPELNEVFRASVAKPDFLARWYRAADDKIPVPKGPPEDWTEEARTRWLLPPEMRHEEFIDDLLAQAARYALAGPRNYEDYLARCRGWAKAQRRAALLDPETPLVFPLVQNIYADWLDSMQKRSAARATILARMADSRAALPKKRRQGGPGTAASDGTQAHWEWSQRMGLLAEAKNRLRSLSPSDLAHHLTRALVSLPESQFRPQLPLEESDGIGASVLDPAGGERMSPEEACLLVAAAGELLEEMLMTASRSHETTPQLRDFLAWLKLRRPGSEAT